MLTTKDPLLLQHRLTRVKLGDTGGSAGKYQERDTEQIKAECVHDSRAGHTF